jgi:neurofibromin 1
MAKKVAFLDGLRKALRNRNEQAAYCLVSLLRAARHFKAESDSALMSYAMDVQDEVKDAVFHRLTPGGDEVLFEQDVMTAAFVGLAHLNFESCVTSLATTCLAPSAPLSFKLSAIQACSHFARLSDAQRYQPLFRAASAFVQGQLKVRLRGTHCRDRLTDPYSQTMTPLLSESFSGGEGTSTSNAAERHSPVNMICNVLHFLDASPLTLFEEPPDEPADRDRFYLENFSSILSSVVAANESVRRLAAGVARRIFREEVILKRLRGFKGLDSPTFKADFWRLRFVIYPVITKPTAADMRSASVLSTICDDLGLPPSGNALKSLHNYLESRLLLLKSIPVRFSPSLMSMLDIWLNKFRNSASFQRRYRSELWRPQDSRLCFLWRSARPTCRYVNRLPLAWASS